MVVTGPWGARWATTGSPDGADVVLVHGVGASHRYFAPLLALLAPRARVHLVDLPGFGGNRPPRHDLTITDHAEVVRALLESTDAHSPVLVGHSMGAQVVVEALRDASPDASGVLIGPMLGPGGSALAAVAARFAWNSLREPWGVNRIMVADYARCGPRWYARQLAHCLAFPMEARLEGVAGRVAVVRGMNDPVCSGSWARRLVEATGSATGSRELHEIPGSAHAAMYSEPRRVSQICMRLTGHA